jgi:hypothetical protein
MSFTAKLCNPTPFDVKLNWERGINIKIPAFGETELSMQQMDDFRPGKPGSADVKSSLDYYGLFLLDADRPYDNQALEALSRSRAAKKAQYDSAVRNITDRRAQAGIAPDPDALAETIDQMGYAELNRKISVLKDAIADFKAVVGDNPEQSTRTQLDPKRTVFVMDPPREFPSVAAMEFFLKQNDEVRAKHQAFSQQAVGAPDAPSQATDPTQRFVNEELSAAETL